MDLAAANVVGAQALYESHRALMGVLDLPPWERLLPMQQHNLLEQSLMIVAEVAPVIAQQVRDDVARDQRGLAQWLISLDDDDPTSPGRLERQTVGLNDIIKRARTSLQS